MGQENFSQLQASVDKALKRPVTWNRLVTTGNYGAGMEPLSGEGETGKVSSKKKILVSGLLGVTAFGTAVVLENITHQTPHAVASSNLGYGMASVGHQEPMVDPPRCETYTVVKGDTVWEIANKYHSSVEAITFDNNLADSSLIHSGDKLKVRCDVGGSELIVKPLSLADLKPHLVNIGIPGRPVETISWSKVSAAQETQIVARINQTTDALSRLGVDQSIIDQRLHALKIARIKGGRSLAIPGMVELAEADTTAFALPHEFGGHNFFWVYDIRTMKLLGINEAMAQRVQEETLGKSQVGGSSEQCGSGLGDYPYSKGAEELRQTAQEFERNGGPSFIGTADQIYFDWENRFVENRAGAMPNDYFVARLAEVYPFDQAEIARILDKPLLQCSLPG